MSEPRFSIGIDLGTTHCALAYVDITASDGEKTSYGVLDIPQLTAPGTVEAAPLLPSFLYLPHADELAAGDLSLPWSSEQDYAVGEFARSRGALTPIRLVSSAKSWLCHAGVDRRAAILPNDAPAEVARVSPLEASTDTEIIPAKSRRARTCNLHMVAEWPPPAVRAFFDDL